MLAKNPAHVGIAGWPLRYLSAEMFGHAVRLGRATIAEVPKDLLVRVSIKHLRASIRKAGKTICLAGTTDFAALSGLSWREYQRYLDVQVANARFLGCRMIRCFVGSFLRKDFRLALRRATSYQAQKPDLELVVETHGGFESQPEGLRALLEYSDFRIVADLANVPARPTRDALLSGDVAERIAYFHIRCLPGQGKMTSQALEESVAIRSHPDHDFLWEPKRMSGGSVIEAFRSHILRK